jgi:hypothetical protein
VVHGGPNKHVTHPVNRGQLLPRNDPEGMAVVAYIATEIVGYYLISGRKTNDLYSAPFLVIGIPSKKEAMARAEGAKRPSATHALCCIRII